MTHNDIRNEKEVAALYKAQEILRRADNLDNALFAVGIEILPYELVGVITEADGTARALRRCPVPHMGVEIVVEHVADLVSYLVDSSLGLSIPNPRICVGLQIGGPVDTVTGTVLQYMNLPDDFVHRTGADEWKDVALAELVQAATGCATVLENDASAYAIYEQKLGLGRRTDSFALFLIRDGVGGAVVLNNQLLPVPLEVGHIPVWPNGRECTCGKHGCLASQAGCRAIRAMVAESIGLKNVDLFERAIEIANRNGEPGRAALHAFHKAGKSVARGIATVLTLFGPRHVVIYAPGALIGAGRRSAAADCFVAEVARFHEHCFPVDERWELVTESLSSKRGAQGAALTALNRHFFVSLASHQLEHNP